MMQLEVFVNGEVIYRRSETCNDEPVKLRIVRKTGRLHFLGAMIGMTGNE